MKHQVIAMKLWDGHIEFNGVPGKVGMPPGCIGMMLCFESAEDAIKYWGNDTELVRIAVKGDGNDQSKH